MDYHIKQEFVLPVEGRVVGAYFIQDKKTLMVIDRIYTEIGIVRDRIEGFVEDKLLTWSYAEESALSSQTIETKIGQVFQDYPEYVYQPYSTDHQMSVDNYYPISVDGTMFTSSEGNKVIFRSTDNLSVLNEFATDRASLLVKLSPDNQIVYFSIPGDETEFYSMSNEHLVTLPGQSMVFSNRGDRMASVDRYGNINIWGIPADQGGQ